MVVGATVIVSPFSRGAELASDVPETRYESAPADWPVTAIVPRRASMRIVGMPHADALGRFGAVSY